MKRTLLVFLALLAVPATAAETAWTLRAIPEWHSARDDSPFAAARPLSGIGLSRSRQELELRTDLGPLDLIATARSTARQGAAPDNELVVNQAAFSTTVGGRRLGFGKRIFSWDVGFGFRPLDVIQREDRRAIFSTTLEGVPYLSWEAFADNSSWLLLYANPGRGRSGDPLHDESLALKYYRRDGDTDLHGLARLSRRFGLEAGAGFSRVAAENLELHGSLLLQQRYERQIDRLAGSTQTLSPGDPVATEQFRHSTRALLGATWSSAAGVSVLGEAWYDGNAYTAGEWRDAAALARRQAALRGQPGVPEAAVIGNLAAGARYFQAPNLLRGNLLLRVSRHCEGCDVETAVDLLSTPADGGRVLTLSAGYQRDRYRVDAGIRWYGGPSDAAYRLLPERRIAFVALQLAF